MTSKKLHIKTVNQSLDGHWDSLLSLCGLVCLSWYLAPHLLICPFIHTGCMCLAPVLAGGWCPLLILMFRLHCYRSSSTSEPCTVCALNSGNTDCMIQFLGCNKCLWNYLLDLRELFIVWFTIINVFNKNPEI